MRNSQEAPLIREDPLAFKKYLESSGLYSFHTVVVQRLSGRWIIAGSIVLKNPVRPAKSRFISVNAANSQYTL